jgi:hypothetical protein
LDKVQLVYSQQVFLITIKLLMLSAEVHENFGEWICKNDGDGSLPVELLDAVIIIFLPVPPL